MNDKANKQSGALTDAQRQANRNTKIHNAGLTQRKVVGHPDDFEKIRKYAEHLYKKRGIEL